MYIIHRETLAWITDLNFSVHVCVFVYLRFVSHGLCGGPAVAGVSQSVWMFRKYLNFLMIQTVRSLTEAGAVCWLNWSKTQAFAVQFFQWLQKFSNNVFNFLLSLHECSSRVIHHLLFNIWQPKNVQILYFHQCISSFCLLMFCIFICCDVQESLLDKDHHVAVALGKQVS